jgi:acyl dehydratase
MRSLQVIPGPSINDQYPYAITRAVADGRGVSAGRGVQSMGMYFEEFKAGEKIATGSRKISGEDIMAFAVLTGDDNRIHTDEEFSRTGPFGKRVAHGLLGLSVTMGLAWKTGFMDGTVVAFREINDWKFVKPIFIGDEVRAELDILETKALPRIGQGSVVLGAELKNQAGEVCMKGKLTVLVLSQKAKA